MQSLNSLKSYLLCVFILGLSLCGCKPTEESYKKAYDTAIAGKQADDDPQIYGGMKQQTAQREVVLLGDTIAAKGQWVRVTPEGGGTPEGLHKYCVVAGQFKQRFNAKSMRERLVEMGYDSAFVVQNSEPLYFVVALSTSDAKAASECLKRLTREKDLALKAPLPYLLLPSQFR